MTDLQNQVLKFLIVKIPENYGMPCKFLNFTRMKLSRIKNPCSLLMFLLALVGIYTVWVFGARQMNFTAGFMIKVFLKFIGDPLLILIPFWFLRPKWRWMLLIPVWIISLWMMVNIWYFRFWHDIIPVTAFTMLGNLGTGLFESSMAAWRIKDLIFIIVPVLLTDSYLFFKSGIISEPVFSCKWKLGGTVVCICGFIISQILYTDYVARVTAEDGVTPRKDLTGILRFRYIQYYYAPSWDLEFNGFSVMAVKRAFVEFSKNNFKRTLTDEEKYFVKDFFDEISTFQEKSLRSIPDSIVMRDSKKNLILIIVESFNNEIIDVKAGGRYVMPVVRELIDSPGTIYAPAVIPQIGYGTSGDGQMFYNAGMPPLKEGSAYIQTGATFPFNTIAKRFKGDKAAVFADDACYWNERETFVNYGFPGVFTRVSRADLIGTYASDGLMFRQALDWIDKARQPFFLEMVTISMHAPFRERNVNALDWIDNEEGLPRIRKDYMRMCNYFDSEIGKFLDALKRKNLYGNSMIVIIGDHTQMIALPDGVDESSARKFTIPCLIINSGMTRRIDYPVGQIDIYPTILRLTGLWEENGYNGFGVVMTDSLTINCLSPALKSKAFSAGDLMLHDSGFSSKILNQ